MHAKLKHTVLLLGPLLSLACYIYFTRSLNLGHHAATTAAVTCLCSIWWCTEALPIPVTSILPFVIFPMAGTLGYADLAAAMGDKFILLFMGGFMISKAAEKSRTHMRIAHWIVRLVGTDSNRKLIIGFMLSSAICSMWISNTATTLIMLPMAIAVIGEKKDQEQFALSLLLGIAYGASIGGIATLIGTPPNGVFAAMYEKVSTTPVDFLSWMKVGLPVSVLMFVACSAVLTMFVKGGNLYQPEELGEWTKAQKRTLIVLACTVFLWISRVLPFNLGGWSRWLNMPEAHDATTALLAVVVLFLIPNGQKNDKGQPDTLLDWKTASSIPWGILLLFAGGLALAKAFETSGLAGHIGQCLEQATTGLHPLLVIGIICLTVTFMTELTSNTATTTLLMPILAASAAAARVDPALFMIPAALSASCAFMLPVATPPNAIVFGGASDLITIPKMARRGFVMNLIGVLVISLVCYLVLNPNTGLVSETVGIP